MGFGDFKRRDSGLGSGQQQFYDENVTICPLCGSKEPYWTLKDKTGFGTYRVLSKCKGCEGVISATRDDISSGGVKKLRMLTTNGIITAIAKKHAGKDANTVYIRIDELGHSGASADLKGKEFSLEEIQEMGSKF